MTPFTRAVRWSPVALLGLLGPAWGQGSPPAAGYVFPAGGRQGSTVVVTVGGEHLDGAAAVTVSGDGVKARVVGHTRPLNQRELGALRRRLQELMKKETKTTADRAEMADIRRKLAPPPVRPTPALAEAVTVELTIDPKAAPGPRQLRVRAATGMSDPLAFVVGTLPEVTQAKQLVDPEAARPPAADVPVALPAVINSQILAGTTDRYRFEARKGQRLVFAVRARALIPYLADAVPGWFQAALTLYDPDGREVAFADHLHHHPDPVLLHAVARDGTYVLEVKDALYRGREDFVYRLEAGELPFITGIFPLGGRLGAATTVTLDGWNLTRTTLTLEPQEMRRGLAAVALRDGPHPSNSVPFAVDVTADVTPPGPHHTREQAHALTLPVIVNGRVTTPGAWDVYRFEGNAGQVVVAEVRARRLGSPLDSVLKLTDDAGQTLAFNDDWEDRGQGLLTHHADSYLRATLPAKGTYFLHVGDAQGQASPSHAYRLRVGGPQPDFELRVTPCSINAQPGSTVSVTVTAIRRDGFAGEIDLALTQPARDLKEYALGGAKVPAGQDAVRLTLQVPTTERPTPVPLAIEGRAFLNGLRVTRPATPAEDMTQAFAYHHLVPANELLLTVSGKARARFPAQVLVKGPVKLRPGGTAQVRVAVARAANPAKLQFVLSDPPDGITLKDVALTADGAVLTLHADGEKVTPGMRGNLIVEAFPAAAKGANRAPLGTLPAVPFEVVKVGR